MDETGAFEKKVVEIFHNMLDETDETDAAAAILTACVVYMWLSWEKFS